MIIVRRFKYVIYGLTGVILLISYNNCTTQTNLTALSPQYQSSSRSSTLPPAPPVIVPPSFSGKIIDLDLVPGFYNQTIPWDQSCDGKTSSSCLLMPSGVMAGECNPAIPVPGGPYDYRCKLANATIGQNVTEASMFRSEGAIHYLHTGTDGSLETSTTQGICKTCRVINWIIPVPPQNEYYSRVMLRLYPNVWQNTTEIGIKLFGVGVILELGPKNNDGSFPLQDYWAFDPVTDTYYPPPLKTSANLYAGKWYTLEEHVIMNTFGANGKPNNDGVEEIRVDGVLVGGTATRAFKATPKPFSTFQVQIYHGGVNWPKGLMEFDVAHPALCTGGWCGSPQ